MTRTKSIVTMIRTVEHVFGWKFGGYVESRRHQTVWFTDTVEFRRAVRLKSLDGLRSKNIITSKQELEDCEFMVVHWRKPDKTFCFPVEWLEKRVLRNGPVLNIKLWGQDLAPFELRWQ